MNSVLYDSLQRYYNTNNNINKFYDNIQGDKKISLRIIDWFVTNYSKKNNIFYEIYEKSNGELTFESSGNTLYKQINIYHAYKSQLKSYSKKKFDPFCRRDRLNFECYNYLIRYNQQYTTIILLLLLLLLLLSLLFTFLLPS